MYWLNACCQAASVNGGNVSVTKCQSVIDKPEFVSRVIPPTTTKNPTKFKKYHNNFDVVRRKIIEVEERDNVRNFQPPISGEEIMKIFNLKPSREIGVLKEAVKEAILEGEIPNEYQAAYDFVLAKAGKIGLKRVSE